MKNKAEIVIIGAGIVGSSIAYNLAKKGCKEVVVLEKEPYFAAWSTGKAAGGIRAQFSNEINIKISLWSENILEKFAQEMECDAFYDQVGNLFLLSKEEDWETFKQNAELQKQLGLPVHLLTPEEVNKLVPELKTDDLLGATFCKKDGLVDPYEFCMGYINQAKKLGVAIEMETTVVGIGLNNGKINKVKTDKGDMEAKIVVNAAGAFAAQIGKMVRVDIPVYPIKRQITTTAPLDYVKPNFPMVVDFTSGLYMHKESGGLLLGWADKNTKAGYDLAVDPDYTDQILMKALYRMPILENAQISSSWAGLYETTPDNNAILGNVPEVEGFYLANGFSGHGVMHAPAVGILISELILEGKTSLDISELSLERFRKRELKVEKNVI
ncbi:MAG: hypothetical protein A2145_02830 [candidate division Zixibacteria bacterium RBG_16_40_9]|nr:MAG: hypothetical protein A2145_02830 [candidate division Zixibacteria bacterium RBG_16_40_9]